MTFCIGIKVREGVVALADTRIVRGSEQSNKQKLAEFQHNGQSLFTMTSGLRSVRDKAIIYLDESLRNDSQGVDRLYQLVNRFGDQLRRVKIEDGEALQSTNHKFNSHAIIGGRLVGDASPQLFYVFPEGNWIEAAMPTFRRFTEADLANATAWWSGTLADALQELPMQWASELVPISGTTDGAI